MTRNMTLSENTRLSWAKTSNEQGSTRWLPLYIHMADSAEAAKWLWDEWVPKSTKEIIIQSLIECGWAEDQAADAARSLFVFLSAAHDLGKASPIFQDNARAAYLNPLLCERRRKLEKAGFSFPKGMVSKLHHTLIAYMILDRFGANECFSVILGGHHGRPPSNTDIDYFNNDSAGFNDDMWVKAQSELLDYALELSGLDGSLLKQLRISKAAQVVLTGLVIMVDWIASDESRFPLLQEHEVAADSRKRAAAAWNDLTFTEPWNSSVDWRMPDAQTAYSTRFGSEFQPRPVQSAVVEILAAATLPGMIIIEAPTGEGKTEAALIAAEIMAARHGHNGLYVALPTQATSDGIFLRIKNWVDNFSERHSLLLDHGKAEFNDDYQGIKLNASVGGFDDDEEWIKTGPASGISGIDGVNGSNSDSISGTSSGSNSGDNVIVHDWFQGRKRGILSDFVVGTIDHVLMAGLKRKHLALRHLALANKVVIIDECHAYDAYMSQYLFLVLRWLGIYKVPVIILSATLPIETRQKLIDAYSNTVPGSPGTGAGAGEQSGGQAEEKSEGQSGWRGQGQAQLSVVQLSGGELSGNTAKSAHPLAHPSTQRSAHSLAYPLITYTDAAKSNIQQRMPDSTKERELSIKISYLSDEKRLEVLADLLSEGGCAGIVVNTVKRAQEFMALVSERFSAEGCEIVLIHSRFIGPDRARLEKRVRDALGKGGNRPNKIIVIGTQVLEQSLDIDFDMLITDICPMDLLIQRLGRLHRHMRSNRPRKLKVPQCFVTGVEDDGGFEKGSEAVYGRYLLMNTQELLPEIVNVPGDVSSLVQYAYQAAGLEVGEAIKPRYQEAKEAHEKQVNELSGKAKTFQIGGPKGGRSSLIGWLDNPQPDQSGKRGEATVRDTNDSLEVILVQQRRNGRYYLLPWVGGQLGSQLGGLLGGREPQWEPQEAIVCEPYAHARLGGEPVAAQEPQEAPVRQDTAGTAGVADADAADADADAADAADAADTADAAVEVPIDQIPDSMIARELAKCSVSLPRLLCLPGRIDKTIGFFETHNSSDGLDIWQASYWLKGELFLVLDEDCNAIVDGFELHYSEKLGLSMRKGE